MSIQENASLSDSDSDVAPNERNLFVGVYRRKKQKLQQMAYERESMHQVAAIGTLDPHSRAELPKIRPKSRRKNTSTTYALHQKQAKHLRLTPL